MNDPLPTGSVSGAAVGAGLGAGPGRQRDGNLGGWERLEQAWDLRCLLSVTVRSACCRRASDGGRRERRHADAQKAVGAPSAVWTPGSQPGWRESWGKQTALLKTEGKTTTTLVNCYSCFFTAYSILCFDQLANQIQ